MPLIVDTADTKESILLCDCARAAWSSNNGSNKGETEHKHSLVDCVLDLLLLIDMADSRYDSASWLRSSSLEAVYSSSGSTKVATSETSGPRQSVCWFAVCWVWGLQLIWLTVSMAIFQGCGKPGGYVQQ